jgi:CBS domain-containing protein
MRCEEIMTKNPLTVTMDATVQEVARKMAERDVGFIPIVDGQCRAVGTVTDRAS